MKQVSILIPCFNAGERIARAIESALAQTIDDKEVIVVDDGSTDGSLDVIRSFGERIRWETGPNRGGNAARNWLLEHSSARWVQYLDADDYLEPDKIESQLSEGESHASADVLYSPVLFEQSTPTGETTRTTLAVRDTADPWISLARWELPQTGGCLWNRERLLSLGGWKETQNVCQEHELYLRALSEGFAFHYCPSAGAVYCHWSEETVCRKNPLTTFRAKMDIVTRMEQFLSEQSMLSEKRRKAIAEARLQCARSVYTLDPGYATELAKAAKQSAPGFVPGEGRAFPFAWRVAYRTAGFGFAEKLASWTRRLRQGVQ